mmetsp:Transcript_31482/g.35263  ORF Transcript_31482/g.35263 Transcript_31482/m.35263 type:complete len:515 (+) Transcript_31482:299-1843(+)
MVATRTIMLGYIGYFVLICTLRDSMVLAKEPKETDSPSLPPSNSPSYTPTITPTITPTRIPTRLPSPTRKPTPYPTQSPTISPSSNSTISFIPSAFPTANFTASNSGNFTATPSTTPITKSTEEPTIKPSISTLSQSFSTNQTKNDTSIPEKILETFPPLGPVQTTSTNGIGNGDVGVRMPLITFDVTASDEDASVASTEETALFFAEFLDGMLDSSSGTYKYSYSHLACDVMISTFNQRRRLDVGYFIRTDGTAYYFDDAPTTESIAQILNVYFAFWGVTDLQEYFKGLGIETAVVTAIYIDHMAVSFVSNKDNSENTIPEEDPDDPGEQKFVVTIGEMFHDDEGNLSKPITIAAYATVVLIVVGLALVVCRIRICRRRRSRNGVNTEVSFETYPGSNSNEGDQEKGSLSEPTLRNMNLNTAKHCKTKLFSINLDCTATNNLDQPSLTQKNKSDQMKNDGRDTDKSSSTKSDSMDTTNLDRRSQIQGDRSSQIDSVNRNQKPDTKNTKENISK